MPYTKGVETMGSKMLIAMELAKRIAALSAKLAAGRVNPLLIPVTLAKIEIFKAALAAEAVAK